LTWPHGDVSVPGVVEQWSALAATPAGGTSTGGAATPAFAILGVTTVVVGGSRTRGRDRRTSGGPGRRSTRGLSLGRRLSTSGNAVECRAEEGASIAMVSSSRRSSFRTTMECEKGHSSLDQGLQVVVAGAEATQEVHHQGTVRHRLAEVAERVRHALHLAAVLPHGEVPLRELVEWLSR
jgi:hypothetical protein